MKKKKYLIIDNEQSNLGNLGDIVMISPGYARNYLIPKNIVVEANQREIVLLKEKQEQLKQKIEKEFIRAKKIAEQIKSVEKLVIMANVDKLGNLYGSISSRIISETLYKIHNINIDFRKFEIKQSIKAIGDFCVIIKLHQKLFCELNISVVENI